MDVWMVGFTTATISGTKMPEMMEEKLEFEPVDGAMARRGARVAVWRVRL